MLDLIVKTIEVPCNQEKAFNVFVRQMGHWWPLDKRAMSLYETGEPAKDVTVDARVGGKIIEIGSDDSEHHWGTFRSFDPFGSLSMDFHMGLPPEQCSLVTVTFTAVDDQLTRVELVHSNWEGFGDMADMMYSGYGSGWVLIFEGGYQEACAA